MTFAPDVSPPQMLRMGVFGGAYFGDAYPPRELPVEWFHGVTLSVQPDKTLNYFGVLAGKPYQWWAERDLMHPADPLGWFQWYCRYYMGRRCEDDARQIGRWSRFRARHWGGLLSRPYSPQPRRRQALLQWGIDARRF